MVFDRGFSMNVRQMPKQGQGSLIGNGSTEEFLPWSEDQERSAQAQERRPQGSSWKKSTGDEELSRNLGKSGQLLGKE